MNNGPTNQDGATIPPASFRRKQEIQFRQMTAEALRSNQNPFLYLNSGMFLSFLVEVEPGVFVGEPGENFDNWRRLARWCSTVRGGHFHVRRDGISWACGNRGTVLTSEAGYNEMTRARAFLETFRPERATGKTIRTVQGVCRELLERVRPMEMESRQVQETGKDHLHLVDNGRWCFVRVRPGEYPGATMWDASGYYWEIARRIPTPEVLVRDGQPPRFGPNKGDTAEAWHELTDRIGLYKGLRNTLIGCMGAGTRKKNAWHKGKEVEIPTRFNWFTPAGFLIVRIGWEITRDAAIETDSVFSVGDCILTQQDLAHGPVSWLSRGLPCAIKGAGHAQIFSSTCYKIGGQESEPYKRGDRQRMSTTGEHESEPPYQYNKEVF